MVIVDGFNFKFEFNQNPKKIECKLFIEDFLINKGSNIKKENIQIFAIYGDYIKNKKDSLKWNYYFYSLIIKILNNKKEESINKEDINIFFKEITENKQPPKLNRIYEDFTISKFFDENDFCSLFGKAWCCIFTLDNSTLNYIKYFCYPIEKYLINLAQYLYSIIEPKLIEPILNLCERMKDFCSTNSILWKIHTKKFQPELSKANIYNNMIKKEKNLINLIFSQEIQINNNIKDDIINCLEEAQTEIDKLMKEEEKNQNKKKLKEKKMN